MKGGGTAVGFALVLAFPAADGEAALIRGPYLQALLDTSTMILWSTDVESIGRVEYWREGGQVLEVREDAPKIGHRVDLSGLEPGGRYIYQVLDGDSVLAGPFSFRTSPPPGVDAITVAALGDSGLPGDPPSPQARVAAVIDALIDPDIVLHTGDINYKGTDQASCDEAIFKPYRAILSRACIFPALGNDRDPQLPWRQLFVPPMENPGLTGTYYSFDWGSAHFVAIDTQILYGSDRKLIDQQLDWLRTDLEAARTKGLTWKILYFHIPPFTVGAYSRPIFVEEYRGAVRGALLPIIDEFGVDLVLNGHDHNYQRSHPVREMLVRDAWQEDRLVSPRGTVYVVTGGGGGYPHFDEWLDPQAADWPFMKLFEGHYHAVEMKISATRLSLRAIAIGENVIDSFEIVKDEPGEPRPEFRFIRGDVDGSGAVEITDAIALLEHLFLGGSIDCPAAVDVNGDGEQDITDAVAILGFLFTGGPPPEPPSPACGPDPDGNDADAYCYRTGCGP
jgi:hypothetical protein